MPPPPRLLFQLLMTSKPLLRLSAITFLLKDAHSCIAPLHSFCAVRADTGPLGVVWGGGSRQTPFVDIGDYNGSDHFELALFSLEEGKSNVALVSASAKSASR